MPSNDTRKDFARTYSSFEIPLAKISDSSAASTVAAADLDADGTIAGEAELEKTYDLLSRLPGGQVTIDARPYLSGRIGHRHTPDLSGLLDGAPKLLAHVEDFAVGETASEWKLLRSTDHGEQEAVGKSVCHLGPIEPSAQFIVRDVADEGDMCVGRGQRRIARQRRQLIAIPGSPHQL